MTAAPFQQAWVEANRVAHTELAKVLEGEQAGVVLNTDSITVDLGPFIAQVKQHTIPDGPGLDDLVPLGPVYVLKLKYGPELHMKTRTALDYFAPSSAGLSLLSPAAASPSLRRTPRR